jgi:adenylosuccinate synthase
MPNSFSMLNKVKPKYLSIKGWRCKTHGITNIKHLPNQAKKFIKIIEKLVGVPIILVSTGPDRKNIIKLK